MEWQPKGGEYTVNIPDQRAGLSRETPADAERLATTLRRLARLDAWISEQGDKRGPYTVALGGDGLWAAIYAAGVETTLTDYDTATRAVEALNRGELKLDETEDTDPELKPGDYVLTDGLNRESATLVMLNLIAAGARRPGRSIRGSPKLELERLANWAGGHDDLMLGWDLRDGEVTCYRRPVAEDGEPIFCRLRRTGELLED